MRARNLKPDFFKNEALAELPPLTRLLFQAYWCLADSRGVLEYRPKRIKAEAFPYDDCDIHDMTLQLVTCNFLQLHAIPDGRQFIKVVNFEKHQHPHPNEVKKDDQPYKLLENIDSLQVITCNVKTMSSQASSLNPSSLNPSSLNPSSLNTDTTRKKRGDVYGDNFLDFWKEYPRKDGSKFEANKIYTKLMKEGINHDDIFRGVKAFRNACVVGRTEQKHIAHATTWLNQRRWESDYTVTTPQPAESRFIAEGKRLAAKYAAEAEQPAGQAMAGNGDKPIAGDVKYFWQDTGGN